MFRFWRPVTYMHPDLGALRRIGRTAWWFSTPPAGVLGVTLQGSRESPSSQSIEVAQRLLRESDVLTPAARAFLLQHKEAIAFMASGGELRCDGFTVHEDGKFAIEFSLANWPDAMVTVVFKDGAPCEVRLDD